MDGHNSARLAELLARDADLFFDDRSSSRTSRSSFVLIEDAAPESFEPITRPDSAPTGGLALPTWDACVDSSWRGDMSTDGDPEDLFGPRNRPLDFGHAHFLPSEGFGLAGVLVEPLSSRPPALPSVGDIAVSGDMADNRGAAPRTPFRDAPCSSVDRSPVISRGRPDVHASSPQAPSPAPRLDPAASAVDDKLGSAAKAFGGGHMGQAGGGPFPFVGSAPFVIRLGQGTNAGSACACMDDTAGWKAADQRQVYLSPVRTILLWLFLMVFVGGVSMAMQVPSRSPACLPSGRDSQCASRARARRTRWVSPTGARGTRALLPSRRWSSALVGVPFPRLRNKTRRRRGAMPQLWQHRHAALSLTARSCFARAAAPVLGASTPRDTASTRV